VIVGVRVIVGVSVTVGVNDGGKVSVTVGVIDGVWLGGLVSVGDGVRVGDGVGAVGVRVPVRVGVVEADVSGVGVTDGGSLAVGVGVAPISSAVMSALLTVPSRLTSAAGHWFDSPKRTAVTVSMLMGSAGRSQLVSPGGPCARLAPHAKHRMRATAKTHLKS